MIPKPACSAIIAIAVAALATAASAGWSYDVRSVTSGGLAATIAGHAEVEGANVRMDLSSGDGRVFRSGSTVISHDGGKTLLVRDPSTKKVTPMSLEKMVTDATAMLRNGMFELTVSNPKVSVRDGGDGGRVEGYPTRRSILDSSYDVAIDMGGQKLVVKIATTTESWSTTQVLADLTNFLVARSFHTGIESVDRMIAAQANAAPAGFPLKQVVIARIRGGAFDTAWTTTTTITHLTRRAIAPARFSF